MIPNLLLPRRYQLQLGTKGYVVIILHTGDLPLTQYSRDGSTYRNLRECFTELSPSNEEKTEKTGKILHYFVTRRGTFFRRCSEVEPSSVVRSDLWVT